MGEVHDLERFFKGKLEEIGVKVPPDSALDLIIKLQAERLRQFQVRWGIQMLPTGPATAVDAEKLRQLQETDNKIWMFDPRVTGDMEMRRT